MVKIFILLLTLISTSYAETRLKVVVIDTGIGKAQINQPYMCKNSVFTTLEDDGIDNHGHGTNVIGLITKKMNVKKYCIVSIKFWDKHKQFDPIQTNIRALRKSLELKAHIINLSMDGVDSSVIESTLIETILDKGIKISVAAGNYSDNLTKDKCLMYPACYKKWMTKAQAKNFFIIGAYDLASSSYGPMVDRFFPGSKQGKPILSGTSQAAANFTSTLVMR